MLRQERPSRALARRGRLTDPKRGLQAELRGRGLLAHESAGFRDLGFSGALAWHQKPSSDRGAKLTLTQTIGGASSGGADALLTRSTLDGLAANDNPGSGSGAGGGNDELKSRRLELKFGYGLSAFGDRFTWTPEVGFGLSDTGRDYSLGWRLVRGGSGTRRSGAGIGGQEKVRLAGYFLYAAKWVGWAVEQGMKGKKPPKFTQHERYVEGEMDLSRCVRRWSGPERPRGNEN